MANAFNSTTTLTDLVETAYDRQVEWALRSMPQFRAIVDKKPAAQAMPGDVVVMTIQNDMALATTPLSETVDPDAIARPAPTRVSVTLAEYGNAEINTIRLQKLAFTDVDSEQAITIARNMADSIDRLVRTEIETGTQILYIGDTNAITLAAPSNYEPATAKLFATAVAKLRGAAVEPRNGDNYVAYIHPDVSFDLRVESGDTGWLKPHSYVDPQNIYAGEIGQFVGARFIETPRCLVTDLSEDVYTSYVFGRQALAEATAIEPHVVVGPVVDKLKRFYPLGWHALLGWEVYRNTAFWQVKSSSGIAV